jgi:hypothetical protein
MGGGGGGGKLKNQKGGLGLDDSLLIYCNMVKLLI